MLSSTQEADVRGRPETHVGMLHATLVDVIAHFEGKTAAILQRYGPGPRVHYHAGLLDDPPHPNWSATLLREQLVAAQERMLLRAAEAWDASSTLSGDVLDVGCGLGGGAIFWAQQFGARVAAVTCVPSHVDLVARFAAQAGVASRVQALLCNAPEMPGENCFDSAVAVDSSCYLPRKQWFLRLSSLLRPGGRVFIIDCFLVRPEYEGPFNRYWHTCIGTIDEYLMAARESGFRLLSVDDVSNRVVHFWTTTVALIQAGSRDRELGPAEVSRSQASVRAHALVREGLADNGLRYCLLNFSKGG
jgi:tocopherol O-methyltransferase